MIDTIIAGDTLDFDVAVVDTEGNEYTPADGWAMVLRIVPRTSGTVYGITATTADDGVSFNCAAAAASTATWTAGNYSAFALISLSGERKTVYLGELVVKTNPGVATTYDVRSQTQKAYDDCLTAIADAQTRAAAVGTTGTVTGGIVEYTIGERRIRYDSASEAYTALVTMRSALGVELQRERAAAALRRGDYDPRRVYLRVNRV